MFIIASLQRLFSIAGVTFTQLVRMKVFIFLFIFILLLFAASGLRFNQVLGPETVGEQELTLMKDTTTGIMRIFCLIFSVSATAILLPKDSEDRILYTLLCRPLPRWEYLTGKLLGVMLIILTVIGIMDIVFIGLLEWRCQTIIQELMLQFHTSNLTQESQNSIIAQVKSQGNTWNLQFGILMLIFQSLVLSSLTLLLSIFSTSTIFSIVIGFSLYVIGLFQEELRNFIFSSGLLEGLTLTKEFIHSALALLLPNFRLYELMDSGISGNSIPVNIIIKLGLVSVGYMILYLSAATMIFRKKEF